MVGLLDKAYFCLRVLGFESLNLEDENNFVKHMICLFSE